MTDRLWSVVWLLKTGVCNITLNILICHVSMDFSDLSFKCIYIMQTTNSHVFLSTVYILNVFPVTITVVFTTYRSCDSTIKKNKQIRCV